MKKTLALLLATLMLGTSLVGCTSKQPSAGDSNSATPPSTSGDTNKPAEKPAKLVIAARGGTHVDVINAVKGQFEQENNCTIEVLGLEAADLKQKVSLDSKNSKGSYDIMMIDDPWMPELVAANMLLNLTAEGYKDDSDFVNASLRIGKDPYGKGDTFALPFAGNVTLLFYNEDVLKAAGATVPDNWADVLNIAKSVDGKDGKIGYALRGQQGNPIVGDYLPILWSFGGVIFDDNWNVTVDSKEAKDALALYIDLLKYGENLEKNDIVSSVSDGKAAMSLGWPSWYISDGSAASSYAKIPGKQTASSDRKSVV